MKVILSPAKSIDESPDFGELETSSHVFPEETSYLAGKLQKLSAGQIKKLMGVSQDLADLNYNRYQSWSNDGSASNPAGFMFSGAAFQAMDFKSLKSKDQKIAQGKLRILSGLYGLLKPLDLMQPYRLEMGTRFKVTPKVTNLYKFWGDKIRLQLDQEMDQDGDEVLVNCASSEYFKAAQLDKLKGQAVTAIFKDKAKDGAYKVNMTYAKLARGHMTRFIIENDLKAAKELQAFDKKGFYFSPKDSTDTDFVFLRETPIL